MLCCISFFNNNNNSEEGQKMSENFRQLWDQLHELNEIQDQSRNQQIPLFMNDNSVISKPQQSLHQSLVLTHVMTRNTIATHCSQIQRGNNNIQGRTIITEDTPIQMQNQNNIKAIAKQQTQQLKQIQNRLLDDNKKLFQQCIKLRKLITKYQSNHLLFVHQLQYQNKIKLFEQKQRKYQERIRQYQERIRQYKESQVIYQQKLISYQQQIRECQLQIGEYEQKMKQYEQKEKQTNNNIRINSNNKQTQQKCTNLMIQQSSSTTSSLCNHNNTQQHHHPLQTLLKDKQRQITNIKVVHHAQLKQYKETIKQLQKQIQYMNYQ